MCLPSSENFHWGEWKCSWVIAPHVCGNCNQTQTDDAYEYSNKSWVQFSFFLNQIHGVIEHLKRIFENEVVFSFKDNYYVERRKMFV